MNYNANFGFQTSINSPKQASLDEYLRAYQAAGFSETYYAGNGSVSKWREYLAGYKEILQLILPWVTVSISVKTVPPIT